MLWDCRRVTAVLIFLLGFMGSLERNCGLKRENCSISKYLWVFDLYNRFGITMKRFCLGE